MRNPGIRRLQALRDAALREAMQAALDRPDDDLRGKIERIEAYDRLLAAAPRRRWRELAWAVAVAVICVSLLGAGLSIRVPATRIVLEVTAGTSTLALIEPWQFNDSAAVQTPSLFLRELEEVELPAAVQVVATVGKKRLGELRRRPRRRLGAELRRRQHLDLRSRPGAPRGPVRQWRQPAPAPCTLTGSQRLAAGQGDSDRSIDVEADFPIPGDRQLPIRQPGRRSGAVADRARRADRAL